MDPEDLESWFDDVGAPAKVVEYLTSKEFPLSPAHNSSTGQIHTIKASHASILDLGTGNGSVLFTLRLQAAFYGPMVGVDYSERAIELARKLREDYSDPERISELLHEGPTTPGQGRCEDIRFEVFDIIKDSATSANWWIDGGFDIVLDKGTFDAISLSSETCTTSDGVELRICELYPRKAVDMVRPGGFLLITSCNWTVDEVIKWFTRGSLCAELELFGTIKYPSFEFGGQKGQGVASVCFRRTPRRS